MTKETLLHTPVLLAETLQGLELKNGMNVVDCTLGLGGHSAEILRQIGKEGRLLAIDQDQEALEIAKQKLCPFKNQITFVHGNFGDLAKIVKSHNFPAPEALLADLGVSSLQLDTAERGFSWSKEGPLDLRMDQSQGVPVSNLLEELELDELTQIFRRYGEVDGARKLALKIKNKRTNKITTTSQLAEIVDTLLPRYGNKKKPLSQVFQALRIKVNDELGALTRMLESLSSILANRARVAIISFHSLEDRIVKDFFRQASLTCTCPPESPICVCGQIAQFRIINKKPIVPTSAEIDRNPRSRSAKLRVYQKL